LRNKHWTSSNQRNNSQESKNQTTHKLFLVFFYLSLTPFELLNFRLMIYFLLSFLGVLIYSTATRKRTEIWPLLTYSWRKFGEKVLQVPSEMAKGFSTHPIASLFIIGVGLGLCVISRNCEGMGILVKLTLNDMFSVIALPSFLENLPWWQGPTNREYA